MAKEKKNKTKANDISPNSLGGKIKKYRNYRQYTQEQLGQLAGFPQTTAQIRIGQYEAKKYEIKYLVTKESGSGSG